MEIPFLVDSFGEFGRSFDLEAVVFAAKEFLDDGGVRVECGCFLQICLEFLILVVILVRCLTKNGIDFSIKIDEFILVFLEFLE